MNPRPPENKPTGRPEDKFDNELLGLDPDDPEARAFAEHLARMEQDHSRFTVEGYLKDVGEFAHSANRAHSHYRLIAMVLVTLILLGVLVAVWDALVFVWGVFGG